MKKGRSRVFTRCQLDGSFPVFSSLTTRSWRHPQEVPPHQHGVGGGVPPKGRLPHPPHSGVLEWKPRGGPNLTPPPSPHLEAAPLASHPPHGRLGWAGGSILWEASRWRAPSLGGGITKREQALMAWT